LSFDRESLGIIVEVPELQPRVQVSSNLINWTTLTNFAGTNSTLNFRDPAAPNLQPLKPLEADIDF
jgi:hypothetical protein